MKPIHAFIPTIIGILFCCATGIANNSYTLFIENGYYSEGEDVTTLDTSDDSSIEFRTSTDRLLVQVSTPDYGVDLEFKSSSSFLDGKGGLEGIDGKGQHIRFRYEIAEPNAIALAMRLYDSPKEQLKIVLESGNRTWELNMGAYENVCVFKNNTMMPIGNGNPFPMVMEEAFAPFKIKEPLKIDSNFSQQLPQGAVNFSAASFVEQIVGAWPIQSTPKEISKRAKKNHWELIDDKKWHDYGKSVYNLNSPNGYNLAYRGTVMAYASVEYDNKDKADAELLGWSYNATFSGNDAKDKAASFVQTFVDELNNQSGYQLKPITRKTATTLAYGQDMPDGRKIAVFSFGKTINIQVYYR